MMFTFAMTTALRAAEIQEVKVTNSPLLTSLGTNTVVEVISEISLEFNQLYQSNYLDVRDYRQIAVYISENRDLNDSLKILPSYKLDAFFSTANDATGVKNLDTKETQFVRPGIKEFGYETDAQNAFFKTSTGDTTARALLAPVVGPYVRIELRNRTAGEKRKFRVTAYLMV